MRPYFTLSREMLFLAAEAKLKLKPNKERMPLNARQFAALKSARTFMLG
jgi:hypothetical protein